MTTTRRDFLRNAGCMLGGAAIASTLDSLGLMSAYAQSGVTDYRALVCVFLNGGNDGNNMIVPLDTDRYGQYTTARGAAGLAIPSASLLAVNPLTGGQYGFHPNMPEMRDLFNQGKLATICNVGPLAEPLTRATYQNGTGKKPLQLFSHSDQVTEWQTSLAGSVSQTGWGGRTADRLSGVNGAAVLPQLISVAGISTFVIGATELPLAISDSRTSLSAVLPLSDAPSPATAGENSTRRTAMDRLRGYDANLSLVKAASDTTTSSLRTRDILASAPVQNFSAIPDTTLGFQLEQVARLMALRDQLGVKRQIFFCQVGGFDSHANQRTNTSQDGLLLQVSQAMKAFYDVTVQLGIADKVTTFTLSDFGRTFQPSGSGGSVGSDHGWGNHHLVMGGAVRGQSFYGTFPTLALGGPDDTDNRGRWIPTTSVEQYAATLATWYGLPASDLSYVFPLIGRFSTPNLGFMS